MVRAVVSKVNSRLALKSVYNLNINDLHTSAELLGREQSLNKSYVLRCLFCGYSELLSSIEVNLDLLLV